MIRIEFVLSCDTCVSSCQGIPGELGAVGQIGPRVGELHHDK